MKFTLSPASYKIIFFLILVVAAFYRLYNLSNTVMFLADQGRDALIVADIFKEGNLIFIGPVTSVGNLYLGPLYYYFMLPFLFLSYPSPMGPAYAVAVLGLAAVYLVYKLGQSLIGKKAALLASGLMAISATAIEYSRFSWNPNPAPFVSMLMIYYTYKAWIKDVKYWIIVSICFSVLIQLHYLALLSLGGAGIIWLVQVIQLKKQNQPFKKFIISTFISILIFIFSLIPLFLFDYKHDNLNFKAFKAMFSQQENFKLAGSSDLLFKTVNTLKETEGRFMHIMFEYSIGKERVLNQVLSYSVLIILVYLAFKSKKYKHAKGLQVIFAYLITGVIGTAFYQHTVFDHYIAYLFPVTFLVYGAVISSISKRKISLLLSIVFILFFLRINLSQLPSKATGWTINDVKRTSEQILDKVQEGEKYDIVLLSESKDLQGQSYRYFLSTVENKQPVKVDNRLEADTLFIINEENREQNVTDDPAYEIVVFPNKTPAEVFKVENGPEITVLRK